MRSALVFALGALLSCALFSCARMTRVPGALPSYTREVEATRALPSYSRAQTASRALPSYSREPTAPGADKFEDDDPLLDRYRSENFLDLPRRRVGRIEAGTRYSVPAPNAPLREDLHLALGGERFRAAARRRRQDGAAWEAYHVTWLPARGVRLAGGDFVPDAGIGLISSARRFSYRLLPAHPLTAGSIRPWTGFYDSFVRGGYAGLASGPLGAFVFGGRQASHAARGTRLDEGRISGLRLSAAWRRAAAGLLVISAGEGGKDLNFGLDLAAAMKGGVIALETAADAHGHMSAAWGWRIRRKRHAAGMLFYDAPWLATGPYWHLPGASGRTKASKSGTAAYLRARLPWRSSLTTSFGRHGWRDGIKNGSSKTLWTRYELRRRAATLRLTWSCGAGERSDDVPYPPAAPAVLSRSQALELAALVSIGPRLRLRGGVRRAASDGSDGFLADASLRLQPHRAWMRIEAGGACYRSLSGRCVFRYYEPAVPGAYPWRTVSGDGERWFIVCGAGTERLRGFAGLSRQSGREAGGELGFNLKY